MKSRTNKTLCTKGGRDSHTVGLPEPNSDKRCCCLSCSPKFIARQ